MIHGSILNAENLCNDALISLRQYMEPGVFPKIPIHTILIHRYQSQVIVLCLHCLPQSSTACFHTNVAEVSVHLFIYFSEKKIHNICFYR